MALELCRLFTAMRTHPEPCAAVDGPLPKARISGCWHFAPSLSSVGGFPPVFPESDVEKRLLLDEDDAVELLAYLVSAARTQLDEAAEYAPLRLLTAAGRLAEMIEPNASVGLKPLLRDIRQQSSETAVQASDPDRYTEGMDALCERTARYLLTSQHLDGAP